MSLLRAWLVAFGLTLAIETPIASAFYRRVEPDTARRLGLIFFANLATHPAVWFLFPRLPLAYKWQVVLAELWAFGLEIVFYSIAFPGDKRRAASAAIIANAASLAFGYLWLYVFGSF